MGGMLHPNRCKRALHLLRSQCPAPAMYPSARSPTLCAELLSLEMQVEVDAHLSCDCCNQSEDGWFAWTSAHVSLSAIYLFWTIFPTLFGSIREQVYDAELFSMIVTVICTLSNFQVSMVLEYTNEGTFLCAVMQWSECMPGNFLFNHDDGLGKSSLWSDFGASTNKQMKLMREQDKGDMHWLQVGIIETKWFIFPSELKRISLF